ncbi:MAG: sigma-70 family RNA polymerase sigma factor [Candidatus Poribacteria bacterium]|nr:sigma-70 family RNA polymerase sigma factor [Candidatus Poribacteria bacterium]
MNTNDADLIQRTLDGDEGAFTALVNKYQKSVHALVWRKIGDFHIAEEITQDVFLKVYKRLSTLKRRDHFPGWLYVIATRHCIAWLRKKQLPTKSLDAMSTTELEEICYAQYKADRDEEAAIEHRRELVKRLLQKLPESEHTVVTLYYLAEMTGEEISVFLGVSPGTVRSRLLRARQRLKKEESMIQEVLNNFQLSPNLTENIIRETARLKPVSPSANRPWLPWGLSFASTLLVILMIGFGTLALSRFQQPYNLDATSEMTIELVDTPIVLELERKSDALTRFGRADTPNRNSGSGFQAEPLLIAAAQADETDLPVAKPQWIQTKGPGGVSSAGLFLTSDQTLYAIAKTGLYQLTEEADAWTFVSASGPNREFDPIMAERDGTLYLLTPNELLASIDDGKTWNTLSERPEGHARALIITDTAMYLVLQTEVFRSKDVGNQWEPIGKNLKTDNVPEGGNPNFRIWDALAIDNILFVGTSQGLYRFTDSWEKLPVPTSQGIKSLAATEDRLYVGTIASLQPALYAAVFYSTNLGDSWINITPDTHKYPTKLIPAAKVVPIRDTLMVIGVDGVLLSFDQGETWTDPGRDPHVFSLGVSQVVALDPNNFYKTDVSGITRSTDGGITWNLFTTGLVNSKVPNVGIVKNVLYAVTAGKIVESTDGGESWETVNVNDGGEFLIPRFETTDDALYVSSIANHRTQLFHLPIGGDALVLVQGMPDFDEDDLYTEWKKRLQKARETNVNVRETEELWHQSLHLIAREDITNGGFTLAGETVFMEHRRKLFRWRRGEMAWHDTGLDDHGELPPIDAKGFTLAVSGHTVYAGKREGELFLSLDDGDTWRDVTENLVFPFGYFKEILFAGSTVYVSTDMGVMRSNDGETWHVATDTDGNRLIMDRIAVDGTTIYGVCDSGIYQVDHQTNAWKQIAPELPHTATSFAIDGDMFYIGTKQNGVLRFQRNHQ